MKTFLETFQDSVSMVDGTTFIDERDYRAIQIDALEHALVKALELNDGHEWPMSRWLQAEIQKLKEGK